MFFRIRDTTEILKNRSSNICAKKRGKTRNFVGNMKMSIFSKRTDNSCVFARFIIRAIRFSIQSTRSTLSTGK